MHDIHIDFGGPVEARWKEVKRLGDSGSNRRPLSARLRGAAKAWLKSLACASSVPASAHLIDLRSITATLMTPLVKSTCTWLASVDHHDGAPQQQPRARIDPDARPGVELLCDSLKYVPASSWERRVQSSHPLVFLVEQLIPNLLQPHLTSPPASLPSPSPLINGPVRI